MPREPVQSFSQSTDLQLPLTLVRSCALIIILVSVCPFHVKSRFSLIFVFVFVLKELVCQIETLQDSKV